MSVQILPTVVLTDDSDGTSVWVSLDGDVEEERTGRTPWRVQGGTGGVSMLYVSADDLREFATAVLRLVEPEDPDLTDLLPQRKPQGERS